MKSYAKETWQMITLNLKNILIFEVVYRLVTGPILLQIVNQGIKFSLNMTGYSYLTLGNIGRFLINPWTILTLLVISAAGLLFMMLEAGGLIAVYSSGAYSLRLKPLDIFVGGVRNLTGEIKRKNIKLAGVIFSEYMLIHVYLIYRVFTHVKPLDFVMKSIMEEPWARILVAAVLALLIIVAVPSLFAPHGCMIEQKSFPDSMDKSRRLLQGRLGRTVLELGLYQAALVLALLLSYLLCGAFVGVMVVLFVDPKLEAAYFVKACGRVEWVLLFLTSTFACLIHFAAVTVRYYQYSNRMQHEETWDFHYRQIKTSRKKGAVLMLGVMAAASCVCLFDTAYNGDFLTKSLAVETEITAHRGSSRTAPENTMAAIQAAVEELANRVEIDVQETADGQVVLCHDTSLKRVTGVNKRVSDLTYEELLKLDAGGWFSSEYKGEPIPTLGQVMEYAKGKIDLNIEIKNLGNSSGLPEKVLELVDHYDMKEQCVITSTNLNYLRRVKALEEEIKTGYILSAAYGDYYSDEDIDFISIRSSFVTDKMIEKSHEAGKAVHAWTVNTKQELERMRMLGVDNIITDYPVQAREVLYGEGVAKNLFEYLRPLFK